MMTLIEKTWIAESEKDREQILDTLSRAPEQTILVSWLNAHSYTAAQQDSQLRDDLLGATYVLRDGVGMSLLLAAAGKKPGLNMNGTDLIPAILQRCAGRHVALIGTCEPYLSWAADKVKGWGLDVVLRMDGFQPTEAYGEALAKKTNIDLVVLAMGVPKQEKVAAYLAAHINRPIVILNGGAILDFISERFPRAPLFVRRLKLEWAFRLLQEPGRLWQRYVLGAPYLALYAWRLRRP